MAERIEILITAKDQSSRAIKSLERSISSLNQNIKGVGQQGKAASTGIKRVGDSAQAASTGVSALRAGLVSLAAGFSLGAVVATVREFEQSVAGVRAIISGAGGDARATAQEFAVLEGVIRDLGKSTQFSAGQVANAAEFLARAGFNVQQTAAALPATLDLAAAGQLGIAEAADIASNVLTGFNLTAEDTTRVADLLAGAAARTNTNVSQLGQALSFVAPISASFGVSIEETSAALGLLSDAGIQATRAGTGLRGIISRLADPTSEAANALQAIGVTLQEVDPAANSLTQIFQTLRNAGLDASGAFQVFGQIAAPAATVLLRASDNGDAATKSLANLTQTFGNLNGEAAATAAVLGDTLQGATRRLQSAVDELFISIGEGGLGGGLRVLVDTLAGFVTGLTASTSELANTTSGAVFFGNALRETLAPIAQLLSDLSAIVGQLFGANENANLLGASLVTVGTIVAGLIDAFSAVAAVVAQIGAVIIRSVVQPILTAIDGIAELASIVSDDLAASVRNVGASVQAGVDALADPLEQFAADTANAFLDGETRVQNYINKLGEVSTAEVLAAEGAKTAAETRNQAIQSTAEVTQAQSTAVADTVEANEIRNQTNLQRTNDVAAGRARAVPTATPTPTTPVTDVVDTGTREVGQDIVQLGDLVETESQQINLNLSQGFGDAFSDVVDGSKSAGDAFRDFAISVLDQIAEISAANLAESLFGGGGGGGGFDIGGLLGGGGGGGGFDFGSLLGGIFGFADGGAVRGPGTGTSDSIPAMLSNGEYVIPAAATRKLGLNFLEQLRRGVRPSSLPRFANGGLVSDSGAGSQQAAQQQQSALNLQINNIVDPDMVADGLTTPASTRAILNIIKKNSRAVKQSLPST